MEIEPPDTADVSDRRLAHTVGATIVVLSVFMALSKVKDDNIVQAQMQAKADSLDRWAQYQATRTKLHLAENSLAEVRLIATVPAVSAAAVQERVARLEQDSARYQAESAQLSAQAKALEASVDELGRRDDQFDMSDALVSIAVAIAATAVLVETWWLLYASWAFGALGLLVGGAGFLGISLRWEWLIRLLS